MNVRRGWSVHANLEKVEQCMCVCACAMRKNRGFVLCVSKPVCCRKFNGVGYHSG